jgi:threonyl-tRNA synthetase
MGRLHQTGTLQLDFQLPRRFGLVYTGSTTDQATSPSNNTKTIEDSDNRPVLIHRAVLGSIERFLAILCEHTMGKWPFWISPRQVLIVTTRNDPEVDAFAKEIYRIVKFGSIHNKTHVKDLLHQEGYEVEMDTSDKTLSNKIRIANELRFHTIFIIGDQEVNSETVMVRNTYSKQAMEGQPIPKNQILSYLQELHDKSMTESR